MIFFQPDRMAKRRCCPVAYRIITVGTYPLIPWMRLPSRRSPLYFCARSGFTRPAFVLRISRFSMRLSRYFLPILRENPKEAEIVSHRLMLRAGMLCLVVVGFFVFLLLGFRVLKK